MVQRTNYIRNICRSLFRMMEDEAEYGTYETEKAFKYLQTRIRGERAKRVDMKLRYFYRVAAVLFIPLLLSSAVLFYLYNNKEGKDTGLLTYQTVSAMPGTITQLELPDRSRVWLNSGSSLSYPVDFRGEERVVYLEGEGYFDVESDPDHPFYVCSNHDIRVKSYGTQFNVNSYDEDNSFEAVLVEGKIDVLIRDKTIAVKPHESVLFEAATERTLVATVAIDEKTAWKDGCIIFRNASLEQVLKALSRRYNMDIELQREVQTDYKFRASFSTETFTQIMNYLKLAAPIEWSFAEVGQNADASYDKQKVSVYLKKKR